MCYSKDSKLLIAASSENVLKSFEHLIFHYNSQDFSQNLTMGFRSSNRVNTTAWSYCYTSCQW